METITVQGLDSPFRYGLTFCFMLLAGVYFGNLQDGLFWIIFGYLLFSCLGFCIAGAMLQKTVRVFSKKAFVQYGIYLAIASVVVFGVKYDLMGYEDKMPSLNKVSAVHYTAISNSSPHGQTMLYRTEEDMAKIQALHRKIVNTRAKAQAAENMVYVEIVYHLNNYSKVARTYNRVDHQAYLEVIAPIHNQAAFKKANYHVFNLDPSDVEKINVSYDNKSFTVTDSAAIKQAVAILRQDILDTPYEELTIPKYWGYLEIVLKDEAVREGYGTRRYYYMNWHQSFFGFSVWLSRMGYY